MAIRVEDLTSIFVQELKKRVRSWLVKCHLEGFVYFKAVKYQQEIHSLVDKFFKRLSVWDQSFTLSLKEENLPILTIGAEIFGNEIQSIYAEFPLRVEEKQELKKMLGISFDPNYKPEYLGRVQFLK